MVSVSVLMPVFNSEKYLSDAVESILAQTFTDLEFLILDDGSTDESLRMLERFAARDRRVRVTSRENKGIFVSRNELLEASQGEFIAVMDADDVALPERLSLQVDFLRAHPEVVCVGGAMEMIDGAGRYLTRLLLPTSDRAIQEDALKGAGSIAHPCAMIRKAALVQINGYDARMTVAGDLDLWLRLGEIGQLANLDEALIRYRLHEGSISEQKGKEQRSAARDACERAWKRRGIQGEFKASEPWRPGQDRESRLRFMLKYGWWAFDSGERRTAIIYGWRAIRARPFRSDGWKLFACALLKPFDHKN